MTGFDGTVSDIVVMILSKFFKRSPQLSAFFKYNVSRGKYTSITGLREPSESVYDRFPELWNTEGREKICTMRWSVD